MAAGREYYGDLTGAHMYARWCQEYELATALGAQSYTFHLIDYAPIDGMWDFTISKADIRQAMISMLQHFLNELLDRGLIGPDSPQIELENAGWGLEHGMQTAEDYAMLYRQIYDPFHKVKLGRLRPEGYPVFYKWYFHRGILPEHFRLKDLGRAGGVRCGHRALQV